MSEIWVHDNQRTYAFDATAQPIASVPPDSVVVFDTLDTSSGFIKSRDDIARYAAVRRADRVNPATGPIAIEGAQPGDTVTVTIEAIRLRPPGCVRALTTMGVLLREIPDLHGSMVSVEGDRLRLDIGVDLPARPMVGVLGVAPQQEAISTLHPGDHGGNMDINDLGVEAKAYLPVFVPGALLALGDVHASMGDGEVAGTGIEISATVTTRIGLIKDKAWPRPWIERPHAWVSYGHGHNLEQAVQQATLDMVSLLKDLVNLDQASAYMLISAVGDVGIGQACAGPIHRTAKVVMPKLNPTDRGFLASASSE